MHHEIIPLSNKCSTRIKGLGKKSMTDAPCDSSCESQFSHATSTHADFSLCLPKLRPRQTSQRISTSTWTPRRPRRQRSPSSPSSGSSRRRSETRSPSERHVAPSLCGRVWGSGQGQHSGDGVRFACKQIHTCGNSWDSRGGGQGG